ncbi:UDP-glycosyltransferase UGT5-like [Anticarsia gemmatalis]|uniref:UDP-glycosyltransferase UGT5-like n=1 Tax=Anticarsia gemmatalis TaxID=129554 RepID=UPI003F778259
MKYIVLLALIVACESYNILVLLPYPGKSHHMVFEPLLDELTTRGHNLTVVSFFPSTKVNKNRRDVSLVEFARLNVEIVDLQTCDCTPNFLLKFIHHVQTVHSFTKASVELCEKLINSQVFEEFVKAEGNYDVILVEHFNSDCMLGLVHNYGLPSVGLMSCTLMPWTPSWIGGDDNPATFPSMMQPFTEDMTFMEMVENFIDIMFNKYWHSYYVGIKERSMLEARLGRTLPSLNEVAGNTSVVLVNTYHALNGVRVLPPSVIEVGGIHLHNRSIKPLPSDIEEWVIESRHGAILFSFGSLIKGSTMPRKQLEAILKVFARLPQRIVWKWEGDTIKNLPDNIMIKRWLPQFDILNHPNCVAFITHGGLLSLTEAVALGVPALIIPVLGDQPGNAAYAKRAGIAEVLPFSEINEYNLYAAMVKVLSPEMSARARSFSELWWDRPLSPMDTAIYYIEKTAKYGRLNMTSHARLLNKPQLLLFYNMEFIVLFVCFLSISLAIYRCCCKTKRVKVKQN